LRASSTTPGCTTARRASVYPIRPAMMTGWQLTRRDFSD
jgi:hypothetical protein